MLGIIIITLISWGILFLFEKIHLDSLGIKPTPKRASQFVTGFLFAGILCALTKSFDTLLSNSSWTLTANPDLIKFAKAFWWDIKSVLTEELLFRGAILLILIQRIGPNKAILLSATAFGIYHWFSYNIIGNIVPMTLIFLGTGLMGYAWAFGFSKTKSMFLPFGLHLGWNFVNNTIFSQGPLGEILLVESPGNEMSVIKDLVVYFISMIAAPLIILKWIQFTTRDETGTADESNSKL